ncbi:unnamed protein product [Closterium sp. Yama58-4]|nr:unnamed protein product [Closterium sp. Yama58-4]
MSRMCGSRWVLVPLLALTVLGAAIPAGHGMPQISPELAEAAKRLHESWTKVYNLGEDTTRSPSPLSFPPDVPPAPHLEDCTVKTALRVKAEARGANGEDPEWVRPGKCCNCTPQPPWIRGSDAANLALTRVFQRDLWERQFPASCAGRRLMITDWPPKHHGTGNMVHVMGSFLNAAVRHNRTLVIRPRTFHRASGQECADIGQEGEWECYFFPVASPDCLKVALAAEAAAPIALFNDSKETVLASATQVVICNDTHYHHDAARAARNHLQWHGTSLNSPSHRLFPLSVPSLPSLPTLSSLSPYPLFPLSLPSLPSLPTLSSLSTPFPYPHYCSLWVAPDGRPPELDHPFTIEQLGRIWVPNDNHIGERWWRSQTARFLMRWPSALLCHITNRVRHNTYGMAVAERVVAATAQQQSIRHSTPPNTPESQHLNTLPDASSAVPPSVAYKSSLAGTVWQMKGFAGCVGTRCNESEACVGAGSANAGGGAAVEFSSLQDEPFIFRPYVSLHVRLSDKYLEMKLHFFATYMYFMYKLRAHVPNLEHVWLSTEMQSVIEETSNFPDWTFHYTTSGRVTSAMQMQEEHVKDKQRTGEIFANLIITTQADYFVGALASNWNRLIDELRSTNGRLYSGHVALNEAWT